MRSTSHGIGAAVGAVLATVAAAILPLSAWASGVDPSASSFALAEGGSTTITKTVHTPPIPPRPDIVLLADTTGSMGSALSNVKSNVSSVVSTVKSAQPDAQFAVANYRDFFNCPGDGYAYRLDQALTGDTSAIQAGVNTWSALGGCDTPEQQLNALFHIATDTGGAAVGFRSGSTRVVAWFGDSNGHDPSFGHTLSDVAGALQAAHVKVLAVPVDSGAGNGLDTIAEDGQHQASFLASATGGTVLSSTTPDNVSNAILSGLQNLPADVTPAVGPCDPNLSVTFDAPKKTVTSGQDVTFQETVTVASGATPGSTLNCSVDFLINGAHQTGFTETITNAVPRHATAISVGSVTGDFHDATTVSATLSDAVTGVGVAGQPVTFSMGPAPDTCSGVTTSGGHVSCSLTPSQAAGAYDLVASFAGSGPLQPSSAHATFTVTREETTLAYSGDTLIANGGAAHLSARLLEDGSAPIQGRSVTFTLGSGSSAQTCGATTDATGSAHCLIPTVNQPLGPGTVTATFGGDGFYLPASATANTLLFAFLAHGSFVVGDQDAALGTHVTFWGSQWSSDNSLSGGPAPEAFKGFADTTAEPPAAGQGWTSDPGNSADPPADLPSYMGVIVSSKVSKSGSTISGDTVRIVVVHVAAGYAPNPGHPGEGTVVASL